MSVNQGNTAALSRLEEKLLHLRHLTEANQFMVEVLKEQGDRLQKIEADEARQMLRVQARAAFGPTGAEAAKPEVLAILEQALGTEHSAQIIPFPKRA
ncbi:hypothetical protein PXK00_18375 [Phaeobacter sp. QD34_3]|uniref:hypothetical protein n=1 Tax=unclassified Phaeobacter TaxID=2621772 RepID=UPI00237F76D8|nr:MULTISPECIES: hypothetical protein [unclassified Phaeobacter]MDE4135080.1 hypothetical protein [Phaeobacter sp. QD34_3]MDE4138710.1 hypothetical protein [Phaeobacter sp. QD34_24]